MMGHDPKCECNVCVLEREIDRLREWVEKVQDRVTALEERTQPEALVKTVMDTPLTSNEYLKRVGWDLKSVPDPEFDWERVNLEPPLTVPAEALVRETDSVPQWHQEMYTSNFRDPTPLEEFNREVEERLRRIEAYRKSKQDLAQPIVVEGSP